MKKVILLVAMFVGISTASYSQAGKEANGKSGNFFTRLFHLPSKPRAQMKHFDKAPKDPLIKHNGTSFWRSRKRQYKVDGDGFGMSTQAGGKKRGKKHGIK